MSVQRLSCIGLAALLTVASMAIAQEGTQAFTAHTEPSKRSKVNFSAPGVVIEILVLEGDAVKKDAPLLRLDDRADRHLYESLAMEGNSGLKVEAAKADLAQKKVELARKEDGNRRSDNTYTSTEIDEAKINVVIREIQVKVEEMTRKQKELEAARQGVKVEQMTVRAPFDGIVERIEMQLGETPDSQRAAVSVVKNDILHVNVDIPTALTIPMKIGDVIDVKYRDTQEAVKGKVIFLTPVADAGSETRRVRLEVANPNGLPSGLAVTVLVPGGKTGTVSDLGR